MVPHTGFLKIFFHNFFQQDDAFSNKPIPKYTPGTFTPHSPYVWPCFDPFGCTCGVFLIVSVMLISTGIWSNRLTPTTRRGQKEDRNLCWQNNTWGKRAFPLPDHKGKNPIWTCQNVSLTLRLNSWHSLWRNYFIIIKAIKCHSASTSLTRTMWWLYSLQRL